MPPVLGVALLAAFVAKILRGAFPPVDLFAVCFVRTIVVGGVIVVAPSCHLGLVMGFFSHWPARIQYIMTFFGHPTDHLDFFQSPNYSSLLFSISKLTTLTFFSRAVCAE